METITQTNIDALRLELSLKAKNGLNFILAASLVWLLISVIWMQPFAIRQQSIYTFFAGGLMLPLAWLFSKVLKTSWTIPNNPLDPLGMWLNVAQLAYFPILLFIFSKHPEYFLMVYVVITGAHFLPYAWFYHTRAYAVMAFVISFGALWLQLWLPVTELYWIPLLMSGALLILAAWLAVDYRTKSAL